MLQNRATNSLHNATRLTIELIDKNDEIPQFVGLDENGRYPGSVSENMDSGAEVITVTATDRDMFPDYNKVGNVVKLWMITIELNLIHAKLFCVTWVHLNISHSF